MFKEVVPQKKVTAFIKRRGKNCWVRKNNVHQISWPYNLSCKPGFFWEKGVLLLVVL